MQRSIPLPVCSRSVLPQRVCLEVLTRYTCCFLPWLKHSPAGVKRQQIQPDGAQHHQLASQSPLSRAARMHAHTHTHVKEARCCRQLSLRFHRLAYFLSEIVPTHSWKATENEHESLDPTAVLDDEETNPQQLTLTKNGTNKIIKNNSYNTNQHHLHNRATEHFKFFLHSEDYKTETQLNELFF